MEICVCKGGGEKYQCDIFPWTLNVSVDLCYQLLKAKFQLMTAKLTKLSQVNQKVMNFKSENSSLNIPYTGVHSYMRSFYLLIRVYAIEKWTLFWNLPIL